MKMLQRLIILALFFNIFSCSNQSNSDNNQSHTIAFLDAFEDATVAQAKKGFFTALKDSGYVEGKNLNVIYRNAQGDIPALTQSVDFFISKQVDLIATNTTVATISAVQKTNQIPVCMMVSPSPELAGLRNTKGQDPANLFGVYETLEYIDTAITLIHGRSHWREDPSKNRIQPSQLRGLAPAGRLDIDSVGLLVLTQDGRVARQLIGEDSHMEKEYLVRVTYQGEALNVQKVFPREQLARLRHGLSLDGKPLKPAQVEWQNPEQLRFVLIEGKKRQIRRMCEQVGLLVVGLKRIRMGRVVLGNLPVGQWRYLGPHERF